MPIMNTIAAVMTGKGTGAISTIQIHGGKAESVIEKIFRPAGNKKAAFKASSIVVGTIYDGDEIIDQVTIGCEGEKNFAVNCHGNPLIVADISRLLVAHKVKIVSAERLLQTIYKEQSLSTIEIEAKTAQSRAKTIAGTKIILNQIRGGLNEKAESWKITATEQIQAEAKQILADSRLAKLFIDGVQIVITGPANSGKSTLLNYLAGRQKSIVTDIAGTTVDYVTAECKIGELFCELVDTAGLDKNVETKNAKTIEKAAHQKSFQILKKADLVLLVLDRSGNIEQLDEKIVEKLSDKKVLTVLNKADLPVKLNLFKLPKRLRNCITISAKTGEGIENLTSRISQMLGASELDLQSTVCFTNRQEKIISKIGGAKSKQEIIKLITELLNGRL